MTTLQIILGAVLLLLCIIVIAAMTVKEPKGKGLGAIAGDQNSYLDRNGGRTKDAMLSRAVAICGSALCVITLILLFVIK